MLNDNTERTATHIDELNILDRRIAECRAQLVEMARQAAEIDIDQHADVPAPHTPCGAARSFDDVPMFVTKANGEWPVSQGNSASKRRASPVNEARATAKHPRAVSTPSVAPTPEPAAYAIGVGDTESDRSDGGSMGTGEDHAMEDDGVQLHNANPPDSIYAIQMARELSSAEQVFRGATEPIEIS